MQHPICYVNMNLIYFVQYFLVYPVEQGPYDIQGIVINSLHICDFWDNHQWVSLVWFQQEEAVIQLFGFGCMTLLPIISNMVFCCFWNTIIGLVIGFAVSRFYFHLLLALSLLYLLLFNNFIAKVKFYFSSGWEIMVTWPTIICCYSAI